MSYALSFGENVPAVTGVLHRSETLVYHGRDGTVFSFALPICEQRRGGACQVTLTFDDALFRFSSKYSVHFRFHTNLLKKL